MRFSFGRFCLDRSVRALTLDDRELALQPKAFELLSYLIEHRDRVVTKDELLERLWPDVVVSDGSLKRAVSLVRSALQEGGAEDAVRTYPRQGYRFCAPDVCAGEDRGAFSTPTDAATGGTTELDPAALERAGVSAHHAGRAREAIEALQRAAASYADRGDRAGAARSAFHLSQIHFDQREHAVGRGWLRRGASCLGPEGDTTEHGHHAWLTSRYAVAEGDIDEGVRQAVRAHAIGRELGDANLEALGLLYKGLALVARGEIDRGCDHHDEAAAAVLSTDVSPWVSGLVYCGMIFTCRNRSDWQRASEWTNRFTDLCEEAGLAAFPGTCRLHRAEVLFMRGALADAEREARRVCEELAKAAPWAEGDAYHVLGDLLLARGALDEADAAYRRAHELGWDPQPGLARLQVARGNPPAGVRSLQRALSKTDWYSRQRRGLLLAELVRAAVAADDLDTARGALDELDRRPELWQTPALEAVVSEARAALCAKDGDVEAAERALHHAIRLHGDVGAPLCAARARVALAEILITRGDREGAELELGAASSTLASVGASPVVARLAHVRALLK